jgi:hypothetical protein
MSRLNLGMVALVALSSLSWACADAPTIVKNSQPATPPPSASQRSTAPAQSSAAASGDLRLRAPAAWSSEPVTSSMRVAQYKLPRAEGDSEDTSLVVYYFGQGQGGSVDANLERWAGQMGQTLQNAQRQTLNVNGLTVTLLDVTGSYSGDMAPGSGTGQSKPNSRMRAAVIETTKGPYFLKLVGPVKTVGRWDQEFMSYVKSAEFK